MVFSLICSSGAFADRKAKKKAIYLVPVGKVDKAILKHLSGQIENIFPFSVKIKEPLPHPDYAYSEKRGQYKAGLILERLQELDLEVGKILGVADVDLYTPGLNFVFGQAPMGGKVCLICLPRLRQGFYGLPEEKELFCSRATKEAVHELGHTFGLSHCESLGCVMHFSNSLADTDRKGKNFCKKCQSKLPFERRAP